MPIDLDTLLRPQHTALLVMECQEGVVGGQAGMSALARAVEQDGIIDRIRVLIAAARAAGVPIFYLNAARRADNRGSSSNCLLLAVGRKAEPLVPGSPRQAVVAALTPQAEDFVVTRFHGLTPFHGTELDSLLRNLGVTTVVAAGVSVNVGITGLTMEAVNAGYQVVLARDGVSGTPPEYVAAVLENTLRLLATISTAAEIADGWTRARRTGGS